MRFTELGLAEPILRAIVAADYHTPTPVQAEAIPHVLAGRDLLACAQTGTGKTAAFALPILHRLREDDSSQPRRRRPIRALVLSPTRELAIQIRESFRTYGESTQLRAAVVVGGVSQHDQVRELRAGIDILVATPGRLLDLIGQGHIQLNAVETVVLDEADHMLDLGFIPDVRRVMAQLPRERQTLLFSATMPDDIRGLADSVLRDPARVTVAPVRATAELIQQTVYNVERGQKVKLLVHLLKSSSVTRALVFTRTKRRADQVARQLQQANQPALAIHGNKSQGARQQALARFKSQRPPILVATDIAARGIDVDAVSHVFNFDLPESPETYVHRVGRTGRAGSPGIAVSLCDPEERNSLKSIERLLRRSLPRETSALGATAPANDASPNQAAAPRHRPPARKPTEHRQHTHTSGRPHNQVAANKTGRKRRRRRPALAR
ncbi:MAG: DEAD/DEAH box helicase [Pirellulales bacterium]|nr:DEAD/DEAH box helicase [Pirellulales bacterium]